MLSANAMERRLQLSGILLILGLLAEALCLLWTRPLAFVLFLGVGDFFWDSEYWCSVLTGIQEPAGAVMGTRHGPAREHV